jgi:hypothetical protein
MSHTKDSQELPSHANHLSTVLASGLSVLVVADSKPFPADAVIICSRSSLPGVLENLAAVLKSLAPVVAAAATSYVA